MRTLRSALPTLVVLMLATGASSQSICIKNARIYTVGHGIINRGTIVTLNGKIKAVGQDVPIPANSRVIDAAGKTVMPGIVDANARFGMRGDQNEQASEVTPDVRASDFFDPFSPEPRRALQAGVTSACLAPGPANSVGGLCAVVKFSTGMKPIRDAVGVRVALGNDVSARNGGFRGAGGDALTSIYTRRPNSRMAAVWELRYALFKGGRSEALARVLRGGLPIRANVRSENDIRAILTIAEEFKLSKVILDDCVEAYKIPGEIAARRAAVVLGPINDIQGDMPEGTDGCLNTAGILAEKGVKVAFGSNGGDPGNLLAWASLAARAGFSRELALRSVTLSAAEISGVADRVGSIQAGKDADLLILSGDPLDITSRILTVIVNGQVAHEAK